MLESGQVVDSAMLPDGAVREHEVTVTAEDLIESIRVASQSPSQSSKALSLDSVSEGERSPTRQEPIHFHPVLVPHGEGVQTDLQGKAAVHPLTIISHRHKFAFHQSCIIC